MATPRERLESDVRGALKAGEKERLSVLRMLLSEVKNEQMSAGGEPDEVRFTALVRKAIKQRQEAATQFRAGGREESAVKEEREAVLLAEYLPQAVPEETVRAAIRELIAAEGLSGPAAMGRLMKEILARFAGAVDGATVSRLAREELAGR
ncbi:MAG TPA: GatB/YqeY domain-containing protein [Thermoanaerobaculia bacterium]|nr:GatB/YqeY domain-containing protein [Thermoanaerobaculia bacterium]